MSVPNQAADQAQFSSAAELLFKGDNSPMENPLFNLGSDLLGEFEVCKTHRIEAEQRWLKDLRQYKGIYEPDVEAKMKGSKSFLRKTRVKVESVDARLMDLLFPANRERNFSIEATPEPSVPGEVKKQIVIRLGAALQRNPGPKEIRKAVREFVDECAKKMANRIDDQLAEARYRDVSRKVLHSGNLYGTGILKGPLVERRTRLSYVWNGQKFVQENQSFAAPFMTETPIWRWYPDMTVTDMKNCRYIWEHHRLSQSEMAEIAERKSFDGEKIKEYITTHAQGYIKLMNYEQHIRVMGEQKRITSNHYNGQYDVYERWGWLTGDVLESCGVKVPADRRHEAFFSNLWILPDGNVIKAILSPIEGVEWPYQLYYFDKDETSIFGEGIASIMRDDQEMINAAARMILDNAAVTCGPQFEVFVPAFPVNANLTDIYPGKVWPRTGGDFQYPAIRELQFNSHMAELESLLKLFDNNADETLAIPKFTYGDNPTQGAAGTMGGLSMLLGQANIALKDLVVNYDEGITKPFISAMYHWNMKFSRDSSIKGDFDIVAKGASSMVAKEVRSQALAMFSSTLQPEERANIKWADLTRQKAEVADLNDIVMSKEEIEEMQNSPMAQMQSQLAQVQSQLQMALMQGQVAESQAKAAKAQADAAKAESEAMLKRVEAAYSAMQAAGVAATNPTVAPAGDAILRSAGWKDMDQAEGSGAEMAQGAQPMPEQQMQQPMQSPHEGQQAGIETQEVAQ
jgi:hypothetical protein